jgi:hypothetical protein
MAHDRSCLMDECEVMACSRERAPAFVIPLPAPSSSNRTPASRCANDENGILVVSDEMHGGTSKV